jgi:hypothetical protein
VRALTRRVSRAFCPASVQRMPDCPFCHVTGECNECHGAGWIDNIQCSTCKSTGRCLACAGTGRWPTAETAETPPPKARPSEIRRWVGA